MNDTINIECPTCNGNGTVTQRHLSGDPQLETEVACPNLDCEGGRIEVEASEVERLIKAAHEYMLATAHMATAGAVSSTKFLELHRALIGIGVQS